MKVLIVGIDSDLGAALAFVHKGLGDDVVTTSRNGKGDLKVELNHPYSWPKLEQFDRLYYTVGIGEARSSRMEVMQTNCFATLDFLSYAVRSAKDDAKLVVLSSEWGSISRCEASNAQWYRISKAALNMGIAVMSKRHTRVKWILMQPGFVQTKMTAELKARNAIMPAESAAGMVNAANGIDKFGFYDYMGREIEF